MTLIQVRLATLATVLFVILVAGMMWGCPTYKVWQKELSGKAQLREAEWNRQITIREAQATKESAALLADAEIERARGVAEANRIIGTSLKDNREYLTWRWIEGLHDQNTEVVYVATEGNIPILEAGRSVYNTLPSK